MTKFLEKLLWLAARRLPEGDAIWIEDLCHEAQHIQSHLKRKHFLWSGAKSAWGEVLRVSFGPQRLGQILFALAGTAVCFTVFMIAMRLDDPIIKIAFFGLLTLYGSATLLAILDLRRLKIFTFSSSFVCLLIWAMFTLSSLPPSDWPLDYLRALSIEGSAILMSLYIGACYLDWVETPEHA